MIYLVDSSLYIRAFRDAVFGRSLREFHAANLPRIVLSAVVVHELLVGATSGRKDRALRRGLVEPFRMRRRIHVPSQQTWTMAAEVDRRLRRLSQLASKIQTRSFFNDMLIAVSAREIGATVVTDNREDFSLIASTLDIRHSHPWPGGSVP